MIRLRFAVLGLLVSSLVLGVRPVSAQPQTLVVPGLSNNSNRGQYFDLDATNNVTVTGLAFERIQAGGTFRVYGKPGTHVGVPITPSDWTLLGTGTVAAGNNVIFPKSIRLRIPAGQTYALSVQTTDGGQGYRFGTQIGAVAASDANLRLREGTGQNTIVADFKGEEFAPRVFTGSLTYVVGFPAFPNVASVAPSSVNSNGGVQITLLGSNFTGATGVSFDGISATAFSIVNDTTLRATVPALSPGIKEVVVTTSLGDSATGPSTNDLTITAAPPPAPIPTLSEWAMILFGTILAGGAALYIQRRRQIV